MDSILESYGFLGIISGQISSRPHDPTDFPQMVVNGKGNPRKFQGNLGW